MGTKRSGDTVKISISLSPEQLRWLQNQGELSGSQNVSAELRRLILKEQRAEYGKMGFTESAGTPLAATPASGISYQPKRKKTG